MRVLTTAVVVEVVVDSPPRTIKGLADVLGFDPDGVLPKERMGARAEQLEALFQRLLAYFEERSFTLDAQAYDQIDKLDWNKENTQRTWAFYQNVVGPPPKFVLVCSALCGVGGGNSAYRRKGCSGDFATGVGGCGAFVSGRAEWGGLVMVLQRD